MIWVMDWDLSVHLEMESEGVCKPFILGNLYYLKQVVNEKMGKTESIKSK